MFEITDGDFHQMSLVLKPAPKVIWLRVDNDDKQEVAVFLQMRVPAVLALDQDALATMVVDP